MTGTLAAGGLIALAALMQHDPLAVQPLAELADEHGSRR